jgi:sulfide dehydrogenase [flavocytochrome c] flavoprotein subunit
MRNDRRAFLKLAGAGAAASALPLGACSLLEPTKGKVVVIGGGFGGATAAKYIRRADSGVQVTLVDRDAEYLTCPFSNLVLGGLKRMEDIRVDRSGLARNHGITMIRDEAVAIDPAKREVRLASGTVLPYDRLVVAPGIEVRLDRVKGYDAAAAELVPHAWKAGAQTALLRRQLEAMPDGGVFLMGAPQNPYRCPPGPYERVSMIAHYFKQAKPRSKIMIVDPKPSFSKQGAFQEGWQALYGTMIEWQSLPPGNAITEIVAREKRIITGFGDWKGDVVNFIPPQTAGKIALDAGLANQTGFCPVDPQTMESTQVKGIHVIGDSSIAGTMPKSGSAASSQAKTAAAAIVAAINGQPPAGAAYTNTCYSLVGPNYGISVTGVYRPGPQGIADVPGSGGVSPLRAAAEVRRSEADLTHDWYKSIIRDSFA